MSLLSSAINTVTKASSDAMASVKEAIMLSTKVHTDSLDLVMLEGKTAVVLGATESAGTRAVSQLLNNGAKVVFVAENEEKKKEFLDKFPQALNEGKLLGVLGKYNSRKDLDDVLQSVKTVLGDANIDHVVSSFGYRSESREGEPANLLDDKFLRNALDSTLFPTMWAADVFVPVLRTRPGSSFTVFEDFFPHYTVGSNLWPWAITDSATESLLSMLAMENEMTRMSLRRSLREA